MLNNTRSSASQFYTGVCLVLIAALGFSAKAVFIKLAYRYGYSVDAISLMSLRMLMSLPMFILLAVLENRVHQQRQNIELSDWLRVIVLGLMGYYAASLLDFNGLRYISAGLERVILYLYPTFVLLLSALLYRRRIRTAELAALVLSYGGTLVVYWDNVSLGLEKVLLGTLLVLGSALVFAGFLIGSQAMINKLGSLRFTVWSMSAASCGTLVHFVIKHGLPMPDFDVEIYCLAFLMAVVSTVIPAVCMNSGIKMLGANKAAMVSSIGPVGTLLMAYLFLGEAITLAQLLGTALVLLGVYSVSNYKKAVD